MKMDRELSSEKVAQASNLVANPVMQAIGETKWKRLSKSTQAITKEVSKLANSNCPFRMLTHFNSADYDRFVRDGERELCYKDLTQGFRVKNDPFNTVPGIMVYKRSYQHATASKFLSVCFGMATMDQSIAYPEVFISINDGLDIPLPGEGGMFRPDLVLLRHKETVPYFTVEVNWRHYPVPDARLQLLGPMERYRGTIRGGMLLYPLENEWRAEVYRYVDRATGGADIHIPDAIENQERERVLIRKALDSSDGDFAIYLC